MHEDGTVRFGLSINHDLLQAERHARLLEKIAQWAYPEVEMPKRATGMDRSAYDNVVGWERARAHIRSLLEQK
jgi:hypothetical protein